VSGVERLCIREQKDGKCTLQKAEGVYNSVSQPPGRGPVPSPGINCIGPREILLELITNLNVILYLSTCHTLHIIVRILFTIMP